MSFTTLSLVPKFGRNYRIGDFGFTSTDHSFISQGIQFCTQDERMGTVYPPVSHMLFISGENECIEALPEGVVHSPLAKYFDDPKTKFYVRRPRGLTDAMGAELKAIAEDIAARNLKYGYGLIVANALSKGIVSRILNTLTFGGYNKILFKALDSKSASICSEYGAAILQAHSAFTNVGCLRRPAREITPNIAMQDDGVFKPWKSRLSSEKAYQILTNVT